ncbi:MAG: hypothetical protein JWN50_704 [Parcubacteria group bacterium]|nr:hypothetical protein [Parcubacteria group bacterium]
MTGNDSGKSNGAKKPQGFATMKLSNPDRQKEIAAKGGRAAHSRGVAHEFDSAEAKEAGKKGGLTVSKNIEHMREIGRRGGAARGRAKPPEVGKTLAELETEFEHTK